MSPGKERIRFPGDTDPLAAELVSIAFSLANSELPSPASCCRPGLPTVLGWQKLLGHLSNTTHTFFFISYSLSPLVSRKPLFKINTEKMCYIVSYNTIQSSIKYQTPFKQGSWTDWQIYKSKEIQRGGPPFSRGLPGVQTKWANRQQLVAFSFSLEFIILQQSGVEVLKMKQFSICHVFFQKSKLSHIYWTEKKK